MIVNRIHADFIQISDIDLNSCSANDIVEIGKLFLDNLVVVIKNQKLTPSKQFEICSYFGQVETFDHNTYLNRCEEINGVQRVCAGYNSDGSARGLFGHNEDLDWHCNSPSSSNRKPIVWLHAIKDTKNSICSWINGVLAYESLDKDIKEYLENTKVYFGYKNNTYDKTNMWKDFVNSKSNEIIITLPNGKKALFFPFNQIFAAENMTDSQFIEFREFVKSKLLNEDFIYHHHYEDGDVILSDQWSTIHKRWAIELNDRLLHRVTMDYQNILPFYNIN